MSARQPVDRLEADFLAPVRGAYDDWTRAMADEPCDCDYCTFMLATEGEGAARDRIMAGVDMPGRIVDDVRPDQRGGS